MVELCTKHILVQVNAKLKTGNSSQETELTEGSLLRKRRSTVNCTAEEEEDEEEEEEETIVWCS
jgi:hypothetical protein